MSERLCKISVASVDETMGDCLSSYFSVIRGERDIVSVTDLHIDRIWTALFRKNGDDDDDDML